MSMYPDLEVGKGSLYACPAQYLHRYSNDDDYCYFYYPSSSSSSSPATTATTANKHCYYCCYCVRAFDTAASIGMRVLGRLISRCGSVPFEIARPTPPCGRSKK